MLQGHMQRDAKVTYNVCMLFTLFLLTLLTIETYDCIGYIGMYTITKLILQIMHWLSINAASSHIPYLPL